MNDIKESDKKIIEEEENLLQRLQSFALVIKDSTSKEILLSQVEDIKEQMPVASSDDLSQLNDQMMRLNLLINQEEELTDDGLNLNNPYFAHMRLREKKRARDLYIGNLVYQTPDGELQIIDWKISPIAMIYYLYEQGDEYDEEIGGKLFEGELELKRILKIENGKLVRIQQGDILFVKDELSGWQKLQSENHLLLGGTGIAASPLNTISIDPKLGIDRQGNIRKDKLLPEITALIAPDQFELITKSENSVVTIQGTAGSGKTTVALHRIAWLHFQDKSRFAPERMMVMVFNKALARYISKVLPSLGVHGVETSYFEKWASKQRFKHFRRFLPKEYCEDTPVSVIRFKKHPTLLKIVNGFIDEKEKEFEVRLQQVLDKYGSSNFPIAELEKLPLIARLTTLNQWTRPENNKHSGLNLKIELTARLQEIVQEFIDPEKSEIELVIYFWNELFSSFDLIREKYLEYSDDLNQSTLDEIIKWLRSQYIQRINLDGSSKPDLVDIFSEGDPKIQGKKYIDYEDDPILLYFFQRLLRDLTRKDGKALKFTHLMIDEVQDLSPIEMAVLLNVVESPPSLTLAGDVDQKMIENSGFKNWESMFENVGLKNQNISTLKVGYRSTFEIMDFALSVLKGVSDLQSFTATRHGPPVELFHFPTQGELVYLLAKSLKDLSIIEPNASIALICLTPDEAINYFKLLDKMELTNLRLVSDQDFSFTPGIDITDIRQVKGLEFDYVVLLDVDHINYPDNDYSKYLLNIGATRAAHQLWLFSYHTPSKILPSVLLERIIQ